MIDKLVRDKIPEIIKAKGQVPIIHYADKEEFKKRAIEKLSEEVAEFLEAALLDDKNGAQEELVDIYAVFHELVNIYFTYGFADMLKKHHHKIKERGGFHERIIWEGNK